ncbi:MAG: ABC transporter ATP-binding protein [Thermococci archaeon]|nr:ABC transporter ATP-binding protein [Thermococci archaeon]
MRVHAENLGVNYGRVWGIRGLNFDVRAERLAVVGHNGSGKTTLLSVLAGLRKPSEGKAEVDGVEPYDRKDKWIAVRYSFEKPQFSIPVKVRDIVELLRSSSHCRKVDNLVDELGIGSFLDQRLDGISSGQAQLCNLLVALSCDAEVTILDEPTAHLDSYRAGVVDDMISRRRGVIIATHEPEEAEAVADYFMILKEGRIVWQGDRNELFSEDVYEVTLTGSSLPGEGFEIIHRFGAVLIVKADRERLDELFSSGVIAGFKRAGLRYVYASSGSGGEEDENET